MGKYLLVEVDGAGHINLATMKLLYRRFGDGELELVRQHESLEYLEREMEKICNHKLKEFYKYHDEDATPDPIRFEIRSGLGERFLRCTYKYYEEA